jgi:apolipoprotein N-acyltransferase
MENRETMQLESKTGWRARWRERRGRGLFWGLTLVAIGGFWLLGSFEIVPEPAKVVLPSLVILWGVATLFTRRDPH